MYCEQDSTSTGRENWTNDTEGKDSDKNWSQVDYIDELNLKTWHKASMDI